MLYNRRIWVGTTYFRKKLGITACQVRDWMLTDHGFTVLEVEDASGRFRRYVPLDQLEGHQDEKSLPASKKHHTTRRIRIKRPRHVRDA
jgi:hypothetical protein